jgi:hypothetical protein
MIANGQLHAPATLSPGKEPLVPTGWEAGCLEVTVEGKVLNQTQKSD